MHFLSERSIRLHREYLKDIKLKISVFEKSYPILSGVNIEDIPRVKILPFERELFFRLKCEELLHEVYFSSFDMCRKRCDKISREYGSEANFLYNIIRESEGKTGYIVIYLDGDKPRYYIGNDYRALLKIKPILVVDLMEHSYFLDYAFDREKYLKNALNSLNLAKI